MKAAKYAHEVCDLRICGSFFANRHRGAFYRDYGLPFMGNTDVKKELHMRFLCVSMLIDFIFGGLKTDFYVIMWFTV